VVGQKILGTIFLLIICPKQFWGKIATHDPSGVGQVGAVWVFDFASEDLGEVGGPL
jgi:hypothetical protein